MLKSLSNFIRNESFDDPENCQYTWVTGIAMKTKIRESNFQVCDTWRNMQQLMKGEGCWMKSLRKIQLYKIWWFASRVYINGLNKASGVISKAQPFCHAHWDTCSNWHHACMDNELAHSVAQQCSVFYSRQIYGLKQAYHNSTCSKGS